MKLRATNFSLRLIIRGMTLELALRFLSDYLLGDAYFRIERPDDNLYRAQNQIALAKDIETKLPRLKTLLQEAQTF